MTPNEQKAAMAGMTFEQQVDWMRTNRVALAEMAQRMMQPGTIENQQAVENDRNRDLEWCRSNPDPNIQPGDLRWRYRKSKNESFAVTVVEVEKLPDGRRFYEVLSEGRICAYSAEALEKLPTEPIH